MEPKSEVRVVVRMREAAKGEAECLEAHEGSYRWPTNIDENSAIRTIMKQFTRDELRRITTIELVPSNTAPGLDWLRTRKVYDFLINRA